jgi:pimeloyl-ACP methyl ester carboxylesterase
MASVTRPTLVLHGDNDSVIRYSLGQRLFEAIPGPKTFVTLPGGEHNGIVPPDAAAYWQAIHAFVDSLTDTTSSSARR